MAKTLSRIISKRPRIWQEPAPCEKRAGSVWFLAARLSWYFEKHVRPCGFASPPLDGFAPVLFYFPSFFIALNFRTIRSVLRSRREDGCQSSHQHTYRCVSEQFVFAVVHVEHNLHRANGCVTGTAEPVSEAAVTVTVQDALFPPSSVVTVTITSI